MKNIKIAEAKTFKDKFLGFMFKKTADYGILFEKCNSIHTFFMRFNIDVIFMDKNKTVIKEVRNLKPWRIAVCLEAHYVLEIPSNNGGENIKYKK
ncbi:MAG: DUF192 domain-containing protein [Endomicrobia bacterium]|nr:DUF192 domain-containing protein [Endomicrobiia bacterium]